MHKILFFVFLSFLLTAASLPAQNKSNFKNGDIIFIVNPAGQGKAIQLATKSEFTHVGIVFIEQGKVMVYHAVEPVSKNTVEEFIGMASNGKYRVRRLKDQQLLTAEKIQSMKKEAGAKLGLHYDIAFSWDDEELYCSEFVWKIYKNNLGLDVGKLRPLKDFDLSHPIVQQQLQARYGNNVPSSENMISPGDMFNSELLQ
jgi:uncharacterized protein YycO